MTRSTGHRADMTTWPKIECERGHLEHPRRIIDVDLIQNHIHHDYPQIPLHLARKFRMAVWVYDDPEINKGTGYCPAAVNVVSYQIENIGVWEPCETIIALTVMQAADPDSIFVDFGSQLGWFSLLAASTGHGVVAFDVDPECISIMRQSAEMNGWSHLIAYSDERIGPESGEWPVGPRIAFAKIDVEGAEEHAVRIIWPSIEAGLVDHLLIEISPVFNDSYPDLVVRLLEVGYAAWALPDKVAPPPPFEHFPDDLTPGRLSGSIADIRSQVESWDQRNVLFSRPGAFGV